MSGHNRVLFGREFNDSLRQTGQNLLVPFEALLDDAVVVGAPGAGKTTFVRQAIEHSTAAGCPVLVVDTSGELTESISNGRLGDENYRLMRVGIHDVGGYFQRPSLTGAANLAGHVHRLSVPLLGLLGYRTRGFTPEMALLDALVLHSWETEPSVSLTQLARLVEKPPLSRLGNFHIDAVIDEERRSLLASAILGLRTTDPPDPSEPLFDFERAWRRHASAYVIDLGQRSLEAVRFLAAAALLHLQGFLEGSPPEVPSQVLIAIIGADVLAPRHNRVITTPILKDILGQWAMYGAGCLLEIRDLAQIDESVLDLVETWVSGGFPVRTTRHQVVAEFDLVNPPIDEAMLERNLARMEPGQFVVRSRHLPSIAYFQIDR